MQLDAKQIILKTFKIIRLQKHTDICKRCKNALILHYESGIIKGAFLKEVINIIDKNKKNMVMPDGIIVISKDKNIIVI